MTEEDALAVTGISLIALARAWVCHQTHVDRGNVGQMVVQEATPGRGGDFAPPRHVPPVALLTLMPSLSSSFKWI